MPDLYDSLLTAHSHVSSGNMPSRAMNLMLDLLPDSFWRGTPRILDIYFKSSEFLDACYKRLRKYHSREDILRYMLYGACQSKGLYAVASKIQAYNFIPYNKLEAYMKITDIKFDLVVGNPPFQAGGGNSQYPFFVNEAFERTSRYVLMICPDRWNTSQQNKAFETMRNNLINRGTLKTLVHISADTKGATFVWPTTGTSNLTYFLVDKTDPGESCHLVNLDATGELLYNSVVDLREPFFFGAVRASLFDKVHAYADRFLSERVECVTHYELDSEQFFDSPEEPSAQYPMKAYGTNGNIRYINMSYFNRPYVGLSKWKVLLPRGGVVPVVAEPNTAGMRSYYTIWFDTEQEARNAKAFFETNFFVTVRGMCSSGRISSMSTFEHLPLLDFTRSWTDEGLAEYFHLTPKEIALVQEGKKWG